MTSVLIPHSSYEPYSLSGSDTLKTAIYLFHRQLQVVIAEGKVEEPVLTSVLSTLIHIDPLQVMDSGELGFLWITDILNSGYREYERYQMASKVVQLLGKHLFKRPIPFSHVLPAWIPSILGFLSLCEEFNTIITPSSPEFIALHILSTNRGSADFGPMILPLLTSTLLPTHPLRARSLALKTFFRFMTGWFSPQMENVASKHLDKLLRAVGDPFQFTDLPPQDGKPMGLVDYEPMMATAVLIEFASSDLWRNHLRRSNFTSCEEIVSTGKGKRTALGSIFDVARDFLPKFLCTTAKISTAIRCLEELQCLNMAEVVIMWAWTTGAVNLVDRDDWRLIGRETLQFYQTCGMRRLTALKQHITAWPEENRHKVFLTVRYWTSQCRSGSPTWPDPTTLRPWPKSMDCYLADLFIAQVCQLRRLYHLFGCDPTTWEEAVTVEEVDEGMGVSSGRSVTPDSFIGPVVDWACDYP